MGGQKTTRQGHPSVLEEHNRPPHAGGAQKWVWSPGAQENGAITGVAIDIYNDPNPHEYKAYFFGSDRKLYRIRVQYNTSTELFTAGTDYAGQDQLLGTPMGTPVISSYSGTKVIYQVDSERRLYCLDASSGAIVWKSTPMGSDGDSVTPPLDLPCHADAEGHRLYVGCTDGNVYCFKPYYPADDDGEWSFSATTDPIVRAGSGIFIVPTIGGQLLDFPRWTIVFATYYGKVFCVYDNGGPVLQWLFNPGVPAQFCETWPIVGVNNIGPENAMVRIYIATYDAGDQGRIYAIRGTSEFEGNSGTAVWPAPVMTAKDGSVQKNIGRIQANPCIDVPSGDTNVFFLAQYPGSGTYKPTPVKIQDHGTYGSGKWGKKMPSAGDSLSSTPIFTNAATLFSPGWNLLNWAKDAGWLYSEESAQFGSAIQSTASPFPISLGSAVLTQDMAMDYEGAMVVTLANGNVVARWLPHDPRTEE